MCTDADHSNMLKISTANYSEVEIISSVKNCINISMYLSELQVHISTLAVNGLNNFLIETKDLIRI